MKAMRNILIAGAALLPAGIAMAQPAYGIYAGATVGYTRNNIDCHGFSDCNKSTTGWKAYAGYQINDMFSVEAQYIDHGTANAVANIPPVGDTKIDIKSTGFGVRGVASFPTNDKMSPYVALGVNRVKSDPQSAVTSAAGYSSNTSTKPEIALGLDYKVAPNVKVRGELDAIRFGGLNNMGSYTDTGLSIGLHYAF